MFCTNGWENYNKDGAKSRDLKGFSALSAKQIIPFR
nr:hypothetical protein HUO10_004860 [Paraburkholderia busanensis]